MPSFSKLRLICLFTIFQVSVKLSAQSHITYGGYFFEDSERLQKIQKALPQLDKIIEEYAAKNHFPGTVYGLMVDGKVIHTGNLGFTELSSKTPATSQSGFRIASMSKSFTSMAILKLRDEGKLKLDDPVYLYIPEMKGQPYPTLDAPVATVRHLLTHAAGFPEDNPWGDRHLGDTDKQLTDLIKNKLSFSNDPGIAYEYSNLGFAMLGLIIKKVSGESYQSYINKNILQPLGMNNTYWEYTKVPAKQLAHGYRWLNEAWVEQPLLHDGSWGSMGGLITSIDDFGKYMAFHLSAWPPSDLKETGPVRRSSVREMQFPWNFNNINAKYKYPDGKATPLVSAYGYGLRWTKDGDGRTTVGHSGGLPGFGSNWAILPDYGVGIMLFANSTYASTSALNTIVLDKLITLAELKPRQMQPSSILNQRKNDLVKLLPDWNNAEKSGLFADNFFLDYFTETLRKEALEVYNKAGKIVKVRELIPENGLRGSFILEGEKANIKISFTLTAENPGLIQEYHIWSAEK
ncbi:serine hydrolase [Emticicia sp. CRIBPO]|uniref:serine hydrolase domain-containing protein n=1 Tax=Emticicia sp. CRIBPO TaxID=2683258 RepID=UPI001413472C|nr:serine hydrolase domain-containing protein [Emticicia sp. CRIBPO]NBA87444.1 serine hydrolase [Emticicia sp. CRIBPO]